MKALTFRKTLIAIGLLAMTALSVPAAGQGRREVRRDTREIRADRKNCVRIVRKSKPTRTRFTATVAKCGRTAATVAVMSATIVKTVAAPVATRRLA